MGCYGDARRGDRIWRRTLTCWKWRLASQDSRALGQNAGRGRPLACDAALLIPRGGTPWLLALLPSQDPESPKPQTRVFIPGPPWLWASSAAQLAVCACAGRSPGLRWGSRSRRRHPRSARFHAASQCDRSVSGGLSLTKHEITFNHKPNVNECNQVIRMCGGVIFTTCSDALIMLCKIMLKIELCKKRPCSAKADDSEVQRLDRFNISFMKRCV